MPPFRKIWDVATCLMEILVGVSLLRCRSIHGCLHSQIPNLQTQSWYACSMVWPPCYWSLPKLLQSCGFRQSFYGIIKLVAYNFQKLLHNHHPHRYRGMEPFCCTQILDVCTQGRLPRISARKYFSWGFPFWLKGCETKVTLSDLMSLQLGNLAQASWLHWYYNLVLCVIPSCSLFFCQCCRVVS